MLFLSRSSFHAFLLIVLALSGCRSVNIGRAGCEQAPRDLGVCDWAACDQSACDWCGPDRIESSVCDSSGCASSNTKLVRGRPIPFLDRTASLIGITNKIALWDFRADNHNISPATENAVVDYLRKRGLRSTLVRSNQYDPAGEWQRLTANKRIAAPIRYTLGAYDWLKYTIAPGRILGGDWYNPYSDTVHLYSDIPAIALSKAAYAKDVYGRTRPGIYALTQEVPLFGIYHETLANREVVQFLRSQGGPTAAAEAERILYPDMAGSFGSQALGFLPGGSALGRASGAMTVHAARFAKQQISARASGSVR